MFLHCHSSFSIRYCILSPGDVVNWAAQSMHGGKVPVCLTDINAVSGVPDFFKEAQKHPHVHPCAGIDFRASNSTEGSGGGKSLYIGIAQNEHGFAEMNHHFKTVQTPLNCTGRSFAMPVNRQA